MKSIILVNGESIPASDPRYLIPAPEGLECKSRCPKHPHYRCTLRRDHKGDHAAHGVGIGLYLKMFARWPKSLAGPQEWEETVAGLLRELESNNP